MKSAEARGPLLSRKGRLRVEAFYSRLTGVRWSKLHTERVQSLEGVFYNLFLVLSVRRSFPALEAGVTKGAGKRLG